MADEGRSGNSEDTARKVDARLQQADEELLEAVRELEMLDVEPVGSRNRLHFNLLPGARAPAGAADRTLRDLTNEDTNALRRVVGETGWVQWGWKWDWFALQLHSAADSVDVLGDALSPDDFAHLKTAAAARIRNVDEALDAVVAELKQAAPHVIDGIRTRQREIAASLERATYQGLEPPDSMTVTGEYER